MVSAISYYETEEILQNTPAGSVCSPETGLSQKHLTHTSSSQRLWCPTGSPVLPPAKAGARLGGSGRVQVALLRCQRLRGFLMTSSCRVKEPLLLQTAVYSCSVTAAGRKVLQRHLGTGEDSALEAGPAPPPSAMAPCLLAGRGDDTEFLQFLRYMKDWLWTERPELFVLKSAEDDD